MTPPAVPEALAALAGRRSAWIRAPTTLLAPGLEIPRIVTGLWQVADMERGGAPLDPARGAARLADYAAAGFDAFDMADHYGAAEVITGTLAGSAGGPGVRAFTKWCPPPGPMTREVVRAGVQRALDRLRVERIDLLQFHWWTFEHPGYLDAMRELAALRAEGLIAPPRPHQLRHRPPALLLGAGHADRHATRSASRCSTAAPPSDMSALCLAARRAGCSPTARSAAVS